MTFKQGILLAVTVVIAATCFASPSKKNTLSDAMTQQMKVNAERYGIVGQAVLVAKNGETIFRGVQGLAKTDPVENVSFDHVFLAYSVSKLFASVLIMQMVEAGQLDLDNPVGNYLPDIPENWRSISVRHFLNHTSGIAEYYDVERFAAGAPTTMQDVFIEQAEKPMQFATGSTSRYNQTNFLVLSAILEKHYGKSYRNSVAERIIEKLKLKHTFLGQENSPQPGTVNSYSGRQGALQEDPYINWPTYSIAHANLYSTVDDLAIYLNAVATGQLIAKTTLQTLWQPVKLNNGQQGMFASGWEYERSGDYHYVGHDGGAKVRVRLLLPNSAGGDTYTIIYLTNGSVKNVWSRILVDSMTAIVAPDKFPTEVLADKLMAFASIVPTNKAADAMIRQLRAVESRYGIALERLVNNSGYAIRDNQGIEQAIRVFELNTKLFPQSANA